MAYNQTPYFECTKRTADKHDVIRQIFASLLRSYSSDRVVYLDLNSGPGIYPVAEEARRKCSPIIAMESCPQKKKLCAYLAEKKTKYANQLVISIGELELMKKVESLTVHQGDNLEMVRSLLPKASELAKVGEVLVFADPMGAGGREYPAIIELSRAVSSDILVQFQVNAAIRAWRRRSDGFASFRTLRDTFDDVCADYKLVTTTCHKQGFGFFFATDSYERARMLYDLSTAAPFTDDDAFHDYGKFNAGPWLDYSSNWNDEDLCQEVEGEKAKQRRTLV